MAREGREDRRPADEAACHRSPAAPAISPATGIADQKCGGPSQLKRQFKPPRTMLVLTSTWLPGIGVLLGISAKRYSAFRLRLGVMPYSTPAPTVQPVPVVEPLSVLKGVVIVFFTSPTASPPVT